MVRDALRVGTRRGQRILGGGGYELVRFGPDFLRALGRQHAEPDELLFEEQDRVVLGFVLQLLCEAVLLLVVGERVRVRARHRGMDESRPLSGAHALDRLGAARSHLEVVAPVEDGHVQAADAHHHLRHRRGGLVARPHRDCVPVVCDHVEDGQPEPARGVQALPELALGARAFAERHVGDLVAVRAAAGKVAPDDVAARLRATDGREALAARRARLAHDVARRVTPVARHLATARRGVVRAADRLEEDLERRHAESEDEGAVPVVGEEPVVARAQRPGQAEQQRLVSGARDLEEHLALLAERDLTVVEGSRDAGEAMVGERFVEWHVTVPVAPMPVGMVREPIEQLHRVHHTTMRTAVGGPPVTTV